MYPKKWDILHFQKWLCWYEIQDGEVDQIKRLLFNRAQKIPNFS